MAEITEKFQDRVNELIDQCKLQGDSKRGKNQDVWPLRGDFDDFDFENLHAYFDRKMAGQAYENATDFRSAAIASFQSDWLASLERDMMARRRSRVRRYAHNTVNRLHAGSERGVLNAGLLYYLQKQLDRTEYDGTS